MLKVLNASQEVNSAAFAELDALKCEIERVRSGIRYVPFMNSLSGLTWLMVLEMLRKHPVLLLEFITRLPENVAYRLHRWLHQAEGR